MLQRGFGPQAWSQHVNLIIIVCSNANKAVDTETWQRSRDQIYKKEDLKYCKEALEAAFKEEFEGTQVLEDGR